MDREELKKKIQLMFDSNDEELWKVGRLMCHAERIDYWVQVMLDTPKGIQRGKYRPLIRKVKRYSLEEIQQARGRTKVVYEIKLEKWKH